LLKVPACWARKNIFVVADDLQLLLFLSKKKRPRSTRARHWTVRVAVLQKRQWTQAPARGTWLDVGREVALQYASFWNELSYRPGERPRRSDRVRRWVIIRFDIYNTRAAGVSGGERVPRRCLLGGRMVLLLVVVRRALRLRAKASLEVEESYGRGGGRRVGVRRYCGNGLNAVHANGRDSVETKRTNPWRSSKMGS
jgi:hypothetical protein